MTNDITIPQGFGAVSSVFGGDAGSNDELGAGVAASYAIVGYKGKVWSIRHSGEEYPLMREDGDGPKNSIEVVLLKSSAAISKIYYKSGYVEGSTAAPDCWSSNGQVPDPSVQNKVSPTCANCPMNAWGSRVTEAGKPGKACSDSRRVAVAPSGDIRNSRFGGPMLLRVPAASLKGLKNYGDTLSSYQYPYYAVVTRVSFDTAEAYPHFMFSAVRPLTDEEAAIVKEMREDQQVSAVLSENVVAAPADTAAAPAGSPFEQTSAHSPAPQAAPGPAPAAPQAAAQPAPTPEPAPAPQAAQAAPQPAAQPAPTPGPAPAPVQEPEPQGQSPESFDELLNNIL
jgi:hypothetical protein